MFVDIQARIPVDSQHKNEVLINGVYGGTAAGLPTYCFLNSNVIWRMKVNEVSLFGNTPFFNMLSDVVSTALSCCVELLKSSLQQASGNAITISAHFSRVLIMIRDAFLVLIIATILAVVINTFREDGIPPVAREEFEILVPCPAPMGEAIAINGDDSLTRDPASLLIDARSREEFDEWHLPQALNQPFDWLAEQDEVDRNAAEVAKNIARSRKHHVVVYGDGENPDSGKHWAALLSESGIKNVVFVSGGAGALRRLEALSGEKQ